MPRFFFHVVDGIGVASDDEGLDLPDLAAAKQTAIEGARDILATEARRGHIDLSWRIDVADANGALLFRMPFAEALQVKQAQQ